MNVTRITTNKGHRKHLVLVFIALFSCLAQWSRWLPVFLSTVRLKACGGEGICQGLEFQPVCETCSASDEQCLVCRECRIDEDSAFYNLQDGVCMSTKQFGLISGFGFSLTFTCFGLFAGFLVDVSRERGSTVLALSGLLGGIVCLMYTRCTRFDQVLALRAALGALQAFQGPASAQMISSAFRRARDRPVANAAYTVGLYLGAGLSSMSTLIATRHGWRSLFWLVGGVGIAVAVIFEVTVDLRWTFLRRSSAASLLPSSVSRVAAMSVQGDVGSGGGDGGGDGAESFLPATSSWRQERVPLLSGAASGEDVPVAPNARKITVTSSHTGSGSSRSVEPLDAVHSPPRAHHNYHHRGATAAVPPAAQAQVATPTAAAVGDDAWGDRGMARYAAPAGRDGQHPSPGGGAAGLGDGEDGGLVFHASEDSCKDDSVVVLPRRPPAVEYTYFSSGLDSDESDDDGADGADGGDEALSPRHLQREEADRRVLGSANRPLGVVLYTLFMGDKVAGAMPLLLIGSSVRFVAGIATFVFFPVLVSRRFPAYENQFSVFNALVVLSCGSFSSYLGGKLGSMVSRKHGMEGLAKFVALTCLFSAPPFALAFHLERFWFAVVSLALGYLIGEAWMGASMALLQGLAPSRGQGLSMSLFLFLNWNFAAVVTDIIGYLDPGNDDLSKLLLLATSAPLAIAFFFFTGLAAVLRLARQRRMQTWPGAPGAGAGAGAGARASDAGHAHKQRVAGPRAGEVAVNDPHRTPTPKIRTGGHDHPFTVR